MATQYLFRLYHNPHVSQSDPAGGNAEPAASSSSPACKIFYTDFFCSLPETTINLSHQGSTLVQAISCLQIASSTICVAVWELSDDKGADQGTPVMVLHPFLDLDLAPIYQGTGADQGDVSDDNATTFHVNSVYAGEPFDHLFIHGGVYASYDLCEPIAPDSVTDDLFAATIARTRTTGRYQLSMHQRAVADEDWYISENRSIVMNTQGTLFLTRFRLYNEAMKSLPYQHTGYIMDDEKKLIAHAHALSERVCNTVTDMAKQRRLFLRRSNAANVVSAEWYKAVKKFLRFFWANQQRGDIVCLQHIIYWTASIDDRGNISFFYPSAPERAFCMNLSWMCDFINLVGVATGNHELLVSHPDWDAAEQESRFRGYQNRLRDESGVVSQYAVQGRAAQGRVLQGMIDIVNWLFEQFINFHADMKRVQDVPYAVTRSQAIQQGRDHIAVWASLASAWPSIQAEMLNLLGLLMTWELTWDLSESGKINHAVARNEQYNKWNIRKNRHQLDFPQAPVVVTKPDILGRFATDRPHFTPFRLHDGNSCPDTFTQEEEDERQRQYEEQKQQYYDRMKAAEDARKEARYLERQRHIEELKAQYMKNDLPVPDDVWDFRNFTNLEWWKLKSQERVTAEFLLRAIDVPDEIDPFAGFGLFRKLLSPKQAKTHLLSDYTKEFVKHEKHNLSLIIPTPVRKWIINKALDQAIDSAWSELGDQVTELANRMSENDEKYSPRQFWPANPF